jgi:hypothetical protein
MEGGVPPAHLEHVERLDDVEGKEIARVQAL